MPRIACPAYRLLPCSLWARLPRQACTPMAAQSLVPARTASPPNLLPAGPAHRPIATDACCRPSLGPKLGAVFARPVDQTRKRQGVAS